VEYASRYRRTVNRSPASRLTALLAAVLFFLAWGGEAAGAHACPHHAGVHRAPGAHHDAGHGAGAHHGAPEDGNAGQHDACTCATGCPSATGSLLPAPAPDAGIQVAESRIAPRPFHTVQSPAPLFLPYFLPYSQAPPLG
jgi:hypothetical protein